LLPEAFAAPTVISHAPRAALTRARIAPQERSSRGASSIGAVIALAIGAVRRRHRLRERGLVSLFAKAKTKKAKKAGGIDKNAALAQAMAAMEALDLAQKAEENKGKVKKEKKAKKKEAKAQQEEQVKAEAEDIDAGAKTEKEDKANADEEAEAEAEEEEDKAETEGIQAKAEAKAKEEEEAKAKAKAAEAKAKAARARALMEEAELLMAEAKEAAEEENIQVEQESIVESVETKAEDTSTVHKEVKKEKSEQDVLDLMAALHKNNGTEKRDTQKPDSSNGKNPFAFLADIDTMKAETPKHKVFDSKMPSLEELQMQSRRDHDELYSSRTDFHRRMQDADDIEEEEEADDSWLKFYEEEDKDEEVIIKRKRGKGDVVDFSFGGESNVQGKIAIGIKGVSLRLGGRQILQDASWVVKTGEKVAMVGANGCGKTTQLKVLLRQIQPEEGEIIESQDNIRYGLLEQGFVDGLDPERTLREELLAAIPKQADTLRELGEVEEALQSEQDPEQLSALIERLGALQADVAAYDTYSLEQRLVYLSEKVGFVEEDLEQKVGLFSGGWKVRIGLSKIFMTAPDVLLLDEPTNHLDMDSVSWLENFLKQDSDLPIIVVTHDREFMNQVCDRVVETVEGITYTYKGTYSDYVMQRDKKMTNWRDSFKIQVRAVAGIEKFIKANKNVQATAAQRKRKEMELVKMKESDSWLDPPPRHFKQINFTFPEPEQDPSQRISKMRILASMRNVTHGYTGIDEILFEDAQLAVRPSDKIGIVGKNGAGKSTLLRLMMGAEKPSGGGNIQIADPKQTLYFAQHQADLLPANKTAFEVVKDKNEILVTESKLLEIMKKFRFKGSRLDTKVEHLSGGERARLAIVCMMLVPSQMLIFDEPTNHLDVPMKETLENAVRAYNGAVVIVSHDRWFLSQTCDKVLEIEDGKVQLYDGDYRFYMDSNLDVSLQAQRKYTGLDGEIQSISSAYGKDEKPKGGLKKHWRAREVEERTRQLKENFLSYRTNANREK